jgi:hypothetical protein
MNRADRPTLTLVEALRALRQPTGDRETDRRSREAARVLHAELLRIARRLEDRAEQHAPLANDALAAIWRRGPSDGGPTTETGARQYLKKALQSKIWDELRRNHLKTDAGWTPRSDPSAEIERAPDPSQDEDAHDAARAGAAIRWAEQELEPRVLPEVVRASKAPETLRETLDWLLAIRRGQRTPEDVIAAIAAARGEAAEGAAFLRARATLYQRAHRAVLQVTAWLDARHAAGVFDDYQHAALRQVTDDLRLRAKRTDAD